MQPHTFPRDMPMQRPLQLRTQQRVSGSCDTYASLASWLRQCPRAAVCRHQRVVQHSGDGHWADTARDRRDDRGNLPQRTSVEGGVRAAAWPRDLGVQPFHNHHH
eukprot:365875-Chlamydomonas_euryale.AAC.2